MRWAPSAGGDPYLGAVTPNGAVAEVMLGFFVGDCGDQYVMVQNPNHSGGSFPVDNDDQLTVEIGFDFAAAVVRSREKNSRPSMLPPDSPFPVRSQVVATLGASA